MKKIDKPKFCVKDVINNHYRYFNGYGVNINNMISYLREKEVYYDEVARKGQLYTIDGSDCNEYYDKEKISNSFDYIYSSKGKYRGEIENSSNYICPICGSKYGFGTMELDHVLPRSLYCDYTIIPLNIVPICGSCNNSKNAFAGDEKQGILSPYYDSYNLASLIVLDVFIKSEKIEINIDLVDYHKYIRINNICDNKDNLTKYNYIENHFNIHRIKETLELKSNGVLVSNIVSVASNCIKAYNNMEFDEKFLAEMKSRFCLNEINEELLKNMIIDSILNSDDKENIINILKNMMLQIEF